MAELGRAAFGEDKQRSFKSVVDCFEKIGQERCAVIRFRETFVPASSVEGFSFSLAGTKLELHETSSETRKF